ncbi:hypothetical protein PMIN04_001860 [Paraphaeosphaeria minitans]
MFYFGEWEDCDTLSKSNREPALAPSVVTPRTDYATEHHCGHCNTPLHHPSAKRSCFGTHAEPCFRFHQFMFMRNRGHTCDICSHIDEHHYKRHFEICEQVRSVYESCGEQWPLVPEDEEDRGRPMARNPDAFDNDGRSLTSGDAPMRKRDRKEQKRQVRAASRSKVVSHEDVKYMDSVLHPAATQEGTEIPANPDEIEDIEQHLKYNAQCYNHGQKRSKLREFARIPDADIDFGAEIDRIFEILRVNELLKRNERNRGLRNKELTMFNAVVSELNGLIVNDLVQNKKDELEIRMRRAAFLRYANKTSIDIVGNRYAEKDWKTGEKYRTVGSGSASSDCLTAVEEEAAEDDFVDENQLRNLSTTTLQDADRRHVEQSHKKLGSDGLPQIVALTNMKDLLAKGTPKPPPSLRIVNTRVMPPQKIKFHNPWKQLTPSVTKRTEHNLSSTELIDKDPVPDENDEWQTVGPTTIPKSTSSRRTEDRLTKTGLSLRTPKSSISHTTPTAPWHALKPTRVGVTAWQDRGEADRRRIADKMDREEEQERIDAQARIEERKKQLDLTEARLQRQVEDKKLQKPKKPTEVAKPSDAEHATVESRKKKEKKKQREAQRKARRAAEKDYVDPELVGPPADATDVDSPIFELSPIDSMFRGVGMVSTVRGLYSLSKDGSTSEADSTDTTGDGDHDHSSLYGDEMEEMIVHTIRASTTKVELTGPGLRLVPSSRNSSPVGVDLMPELSSKLSKDLSGTGRTTNGVAFTEHKSPTIPTTKTGRHRDWLQQFANAMKVDSAGRPLFTPDHPAYKNTSSACWWIGECPYKSSEIPDCPYHRTYCKCVDPTNLNTFQYIVYADANPCEIGPFNCMQSEKLMEFFQSQPETKEKLMVVDEELYSWLYNVGRHWRVESMTMKKLENSPLPQRLSWEIEEYVRGFHKGRAMTQVEQFQELADHNGRLALIGGRAKVTEELLETLRKKCETRLADDSICYCMDDLPENPEADEELVECTFIHCPIQFFHRRCVERLGFNKVTTWYCGHCEKNISVAAQKALHGAHAISTRTPAPDFESRELKGEMRFVAKRSDMLLAGHCEKC